MNILVSVKHGSVNITSHVVSYTREQKMCTGIHTLTLVLDAEHGRSFKPWQTITITEGGTKKGIFYLSSGGDVQPDGTFVLTAQDASKRLVDYFITDTYTATELTYAKYWIEKFLTEAGVDYQFTATDDGSALSNNTALGLMSCYEQIIYLLQISGWYIYFDANNVAIIGKMDVDLSNPKFSISRGKMTKINFVTHDKMLRNRVVVWGTVDPVTDETIFSDVSTITPWNYDANDLRAVVVSNSSIPDQASADSIAMKILDEFAQITEEIHVSIHGEKNAKIGDVVRVSGKTSKVTTQGASLDSRGGLQTHIILGERCPRLFAFFNLGDYVYVGTETSGVYRKHILYETTWSGYSDGLLDLGISDLFVNEGIASCITMSGDAYYIFTASGSEVPSWSGITISGLETVDADGNIYIVESGLMARATIHDKITNNIHLLVDTYSGGNYPGFFEMYSGMFLNPETAISGISGYRTWVVDVSTSGFTTSGEYDETILGNAVVVSSYPVNISGVYDFVGIDIENDGRNDFVSVASLGEPFAANYGYRNNTEVGKFGPSYFLKNNIPFPMPSGISSFTSQTFSARLDSLSLYDNPSIAGREFMYYDSLSHKLYLTKLVLSESMTYLEQETFTSPQFYGPSSHIFLGSHKTTQNLYTCFSMAPVGSPLVSGTDKVYKWIWNLLLNTITEEEINIPELSDFTKIEVYPVKTLDLKAYVPVVGYNNFGSGSLESSQLFLLEVDFLTGEVVCTSKKEFSLPGTAFADCRLAVINRELILSTYWFSKASECRNHWKLHVDYGDSADIFIKDLGFATSPLAAYRDHVYAAHIDANITDSTYCYERRFEWGRYNACPPDSSQSFSFLSIIQVNDDISTEESSDYAEYHFPTMQYIQMVGTSERAFAIDYASDPDRVVELDPETGLEVGEVVSKYFGHSISGVFCQASDFGDIYFYVVNNLLGTRKIIAEQINGNCFEVFTSYHPVDPNDTLVNAGRFFVSQDFASNENTRVKYKPCGEMSTNFLVLKRDEEEFTTIQSGGYPYRLDISFISPLVTAQDKVSTFNSFYVLTDEVNQYSALTMPSGGTALLKDFRYTTFDALASEGTAVGSGGYKNIVYTAEGSFAAGSGIFLLPVDSFDAPMSLDVITSGVPIILSGVPEMIETSNHAYPNQYIFVTTLDSGVYRFYQHNPSGDTGFFEQPSGFPSDSRTTIIRLEDRI